MVLLSGALRELCELDIQLPHLLGRLFRTLLALQLIGDQFLEARKLFLPLRFFGLGRFFFCFGFELLSLSLGCPSTEARAFFVFLADPTGRSFAFSDTKIKHFAEGNHTGPFESPVVEQALHRFKVRVQ